jgi:hypothetical protein
MSLKITVFAAAVLVSATLNAQFKKGDKMAGASVGSVFFNSGTADITVATIGGTTSKISRYGVNITPSLGWFISDQTAAGFTFNLNPTGDKTTYETGGSTYQKDKSTNFNIGLGGFARHYFGTASSLIPFGQLSLNAGLSNTKTDGFFYGGTGPGAYKETYEGKSSGGLFLNGTFTAGFTKMMNEYTGLDFYIGYNFSYNKNVFTRTILRDNDNDGSFDERKENETTTKFTNHGVLLGIGFQVFLKGKK